MVVLVGGADCGGLAYCFWNVGERKGRDDFDDVADLSGSGEGAGARLDADGGCLNSRGVRANATAFSVGGRGGGPGL